MKKLVILLSLLLMGLFSWKFVQAIDPLDDLGRQIEELSRVREQSMAATKPLEAELSRLESKLAGITNSIDKAKQELRKLELSTLEREGDFVVQYALLSERVASVYKASRMPSSFFILLSSGASSGTIKDIFYRKVVADRDKSIISDIGEDLIQLERDKRKVEADKVLLAELQVKVDKEAAFFEGEIMGAKKYQSDLSRQIASLTAKQQQIIAQKLGSLNLPQSLGAGPMICTDDRNLNPGFGNAYAFYTYGIPHRVGMNQYGAYGRAKAGQDYKTILNTYFNGISFVGGKEGIMLNVQGYGSVNLEIYLLGIYEMPESWPIEALKAQAVAARSYALAYTNNGAGEICTTQACQVYKGGNKGGQWEQAVNATRGEIMMHGGEIVKAWYSSTDGGYTFTSGDVWGSNKGWTKNLRDTTGGVGSFGELNERAYDKESPCFYAAQGWRNEYGKSAWLKGEEVADIANVIMLARHSDIDKNHLYQVDKPNPEGVETWDENRVRQELGGSALTTVSSVEITGVDWGSGKTTQISINGVSFDGNEFKDWFNLRAPANIQIVGPLYNVERR